MNWMRKISRKILLAMLLRWYTRTLYRPILVFQTSRDSTYLNILIFQMVFFTSKPYLYIFKYQAQIVCKIVLCVFVMCLLARKCVCTYVCTFDSCRYARYVYEPWCRVNSNLNCVLWNFDHALDQVYNKNNIVFKALILM